MAKYCETCKRPIPPDQDSCPHCAGITLEEAAELWAEEAVDGEDNQPTASSEDSAINLGSHTPFHEAMPTDLKLVEEALEPGSSAIRMSSTDGNTSHPELSEDDAEAIDLGSESLIDVPPGSLEARESSAVELGSSAVIEIPQEVVEAVEAEERAQALENRAAPQAGPARAEPPADEEPIEPTALDLASLEDEPDDDAVVEDLGEVATSATQAPGFPGQRKRGAPTQLALDAFDDDEAGDELEEVPLPAGTGTGTGRKPPRAPAPVVEEPVDEGGVAVAERPERPRSGRGWMLGLAGLFLGVVASLGLWSFGVEPPAGWRLSGSAAPAKSNAPAVTKVAEDPIAQLRSGDLDRAATGLQSADDSRPEFLAARGEALWLQYARDQKKQGLPLKREDAQVQNAIQALTKAVEQKNAEALLWLGRIEEQTGHVNKARELYRQGVKEFPQEKRWFQAQLDRTEPAVRAQSRLPAPEALLALMLVGVQPPADKPVDAPAEDDEAGPEFFQALRLAQQHNYAEAIKALEKARKIHDQQRFTRLRRAQNPQSDPTEEIFLRSADELKAYWQLRSRLQQSGYLDVAKQPDPLKAMDTLLGDREREQKEAVGLKAAAAKLAEVVAKLKQAQFEDADAGKALDQLLAAKVNSDADAARLSQVTAALKGAQIDEPDAVKAVGALAAARKKAEADKTAGEATLKIAQAQVQAVRDRLTAAGIAGADAAQGVTQLIEQRNQAQGTLDEVAKKVIKPEGPKPTREQLLHDVEDVVTLAKAADPQGRLKANEVEIRRLKESLARRRSPQEMVHAWSALLRDRQFKEPQAIAQAVQDAERVASDPQSSPADQGEARYVQALALRNQGNFVEARDRLQKALKESGNATAAWRPAAEAALKELTEIDVYFLPRVEELTSRRRYREALDLLAEAAAAFPKESGQLLARRSLVRLDQARDQSAGKPLAETDIAAARDDAGKAVAAGARAEGAYALGRVEEALGRLPAAESAYRQAWQVHNREDVTGNRYRVAVARVLWKRHLEGPTGVSRLDPSDRLALLVLLLLQPEGGAMTPQLREAIDLAKQVLAAPVEQTDFAERAQALAIQGESSRALSVYVQGLSRELSPERAELLRALVVSHPALRQPDVLSLANPVLAEQFYAAGLSHYFDRRYAEARKEFLEAVKYDSQDARYYYFLGLSELQLGPRDRSTAQRNFEEAARLERRNRPGPAAVNAALERVQGALRREIDRHRP